MNTKKDDSKKRASAWVAQSKAAFDTMFGATFDHRSVYKTLVKLSKDSGIPYKTLKKWFEESRGYKTAMESITEVKDRLIRKIPLDVDKELRIEAARRDISVNDLVIEILTKEARRLEKSRE